MKRSAKYPSDLSLHLPSLVTFELVARHRNFARAADELKVTPTAVSRTIKQLEARLGVRLLNRTTRSVSVTDAGIELLGALVPALAQIRASVEQVNASSNQPIGNLRINCSSVAYSTLLETHVDDFLTRFPDIILDVQIDNRLSDIVAGGFDAGIRLGRALQRDMVAVPLGLRQQLVVVGSPAYLEAHGTPKVPKDLLKHNCIRQRLRAGGRLLEWQFTSGSEATTIEVHGRLFFNEMRPALAAARASCGLAYVFRQFAAPELRRGEIVIVLKRYTPPREAFHLYYPSRVRMPGKLRAFSDFIREANRQAPR